MFTYSPYLGIDDYILEFADDPDVDPNYIFKNVDSALTVAIVTGQLGLLCLLLQNPRVDPARLNNLALRSAVSRGEAAMVEALLETNRCDPTLMNYQVYIDAANQGHVEALRALLKFRPLPASYTTRFLCSIPKIRKFPQVFELCLKEFNMDPRELNPVIMGLYDSPEVMKVLLEDGRANPRADDSYVLRWACSHGSFEVVKLLLVDGRADPSDRRQEAIGSACMSGNLELVKLLANDPRVNIAAGANTPFRNAVVRNSVEIVRFLLADPRVDPSDSKDTAFYTACVNGFVEIAEMLLNHPRVLRDDVNINGRGETRVMKLHEALLSSIRTNKVDIVDFLLKKANIDPSLRNNEVLIILHLVFSASPPWVYL